MITTHELTFQNSQEINQPSESIDLIVTSPPYPMIKMWDELFIMQNANIKNALDDENGILAFELMNCELDKVWDEAYRVLKPGGIACINIGDATRTINNNFQLFSSHSRIINYCTKIGFQPLPGIIWKKQTNAPNKFMGSGMLPPGAYVTLEHEHILIFRKGEKRIFDEKQKQKRRESSYFWEERNIWFSDMWDGIKGAKQKIEGNTNHNRSGAYPIEIPHRLINMFSVKGDRILDPFMGTGTTNIAAMINGRNSIGYEINIEMKKNICERVENVIDFGNKIIEERIRKHKMFIEDREANNKSLKYNNNKYGFKVMTKQEIEIYFNPLTSIEYKEKLQINYHDSLL